MASLGAAAWSRVATPCLLRLGCRRLSVRRQLMPLMKKVHPDLFAQEAGDVQRTNLIFVQNLNEMLDAIDGMHMHGNTAAAAAAAAAVVDVKVPLLPRYTLTCYVHPGTPGSAQPPSPPELIRTAIVTPDQLCHRHRLPAQLIDVGVRALLSQLGPLYGRLGLVSPFSPSAAAAAASSSSGRSKGDAEASGTTFLDHVGPDAFLKVQREADLRAFEAHLSQRQRRTVSRLDAAYDASSAAVRRARAGERRRQWARTCEDVDAFVSGGGVLISGGLPLGDEADTVQRLRTFLRDYAADINFDRAAWANVLFVVTTDGTTIRCSQHNGKYALLVPHVILKRGKGVVALLHAIHVHLPMSRFTT